MYRTFSVISIILHFFCSAGSRLFMDTNMRDFDKIKDIYVVNFVFSSLFTVFEDNKRERENVFFFEDISMMRYTYSEF